MGIHPSIRPTLEAHSSKLANLWFRRRKRVITANSISRNIRPIHTSPTSRKLFKFGSSHEIDNFKHFVKSRTIAT